MNRIDAKFEKLKENGRKALITYLTAGDPNLNITEEAVYAMERGGADIIEVGIPFSDPVADGPVIQDAAQRALDNGVSVKSVFECIKNIRKKSEIPLLFLVYYSTIFAVGAEKFVAMCVEAGIDGLVIPDLPLEERAEFLKYLKDDKVHLIPLVAPTSRDRLESVLEGGRGFVYCVSSLGVTGVRQEFHKGVFQFLKDVKEVSKIPTAVGFGISKRDDIDGFAPLVDGAIVGSAIVKTLHESNGDMAVLEKFVKDLKPGNF